MIRLRLIDMAAIKALTSKNMVLFNPLRSDTLTLTDWTIALESPLMTLRFCSKMRK